MPEKKAPVIVVKKSRLKVTEPDAVPAQISTEAVAAEPAPREARPLNKKARKSRDQIGV
ncbi:hypothetical protein [Klebsiella sp. PL-2018]|uniref:hypothetical protein n=1 Tax=Klebsiella sp. PL-2018 TaxID=2851540 RepID=UPI001C2206AE|nr:hypothetical protein [Klebsiella sp. PL-2018]QXD01244.1 hypothetical protein MKleb_5743 [Klebsiella sp. PL-2018]